MASQIDRYRLRYREYVQVNNQNILKLHLHIMQPSRVEFIGNRAVLPPPPPPF